MAKECWRGGALIAPVAPVMVSCGSLKKANVLTVAWTGITCTNPPKTYISVRPSRYSYNLIKKSGEFVINLTPSQLVRTCDFAGVRSGKDIDKFKALHLTAEPATQISAPMIKECPVSLECKVTDIIPLGSHDMFLADILAVNVDKKYINENGKLNLSKAGLLAYAHGEYFTLGKRVGSFGFSVRKKRNKTSKK